MSVVVLGTTLGEALKQSGIGAGKTTKEMDINLVTRRKTSAIDI